MKHLHHKALAVAAAVVGLAFVISYSLRFSSRPPTSATFSNAVSSSDSSGPLFPRD